MAGENGAAPPPGARPEWGPYGEPAVSILYGGPNVGKSLAAIAAFPNALFVCGEGALKGAVSTLGIDVRSQLVLAHTTEEVTGWLKWALAQKNRWFDALVVDDANEKADATYRALVPQFPRKGRGVFDLWEKVIGLHLEPRDLCRAAGLHVVWICHERLAGKDDDGVWHKGGPMFPSKRIMTGMVHLADLVARGVHEAGERLWTGAFQIDPSNPTWHMRDRHGSPTLTPANLREVLRAGGYTLRRARGLEWQDDVADRVGAQIDSGRTMREVAEDAFARLTKGGVHPLHARWAIGDGIDRRLIRMAKLARLSDFSMLAPATAGVVHTNSGVAKFV